jgi:hypothetical protein
MEEWKDIKGYKGIYQVSDMGRIRSLDRIIKYSHNRIDELRKGKLLAINKCGHYSRVRLAKNGKGKTYLVHRLIAAVFISNPENKPQVNHINGDRHDNNIANLEWCTSKENMNHAFNNYLIRKVINSKTDVFSALAIKTYMDAGFSNKEISLLYNTTTDHISRIRRGHRWGDKTVFNELMHEVAK